LPVSAPRARLQDVAERAGVSKTTASFVMTGRRDMRISADAEERVLRAARELNYRPSLLARSLRTNLSQTIGFVSDVVATEPFAGDLVRGSIATASLQSHLLFVVETEGDAKLEKQLVQDMLDRGVLGFIYASMATRKVSVTKLLRAKPLVLLNCVPRGNRTGVTAVVPNDRQAGRAAIELLVEYGHANGIVLVGERNPDIVASVERVRGMEEALVGYGFALSAEIDCLWWPESAYAEVARYLAEARAPTAMICMNDRVAMGSYQALSEKGLAVPDDVSVLSFDDSDLSKWLRPQLTSIAIPHFELGRRAVELLFTENLTPAVHLVPMPVRRRKSVAEPAR
jgi:LacI family transcriptional regulator